MNQQGPKPAVVVGAVAVVLVAVLTWYLVGRDPSAPPTSPTNPVAESPGTSSSLPPAIESQPVPAPSPAQETDPAAEAVVDAVVPPPSTAVVRIQATQVLATINGIPLTANQLMPPGKFKEDGSLDIPPDVLADVLQRSIQRELILEEANTRGLELGTEYQQQLDDMYQHLTGNPLNLEGGWSIKSLNVRGSGDDADFHVRDKAARIFQDELLYQDGQSNTAATRGALRERLWSGANVVLTTPSTNPEP